mmetsp:Transcript_37842/g.91772  ORF Transcript_37842/g.91772 Transcript_37842/m.91772 type:complete len:648 (-) Transcript_37842:342-2285(-)|eukprot:CAMPEP_0113607920 /NCGR_PEP_ID=MMETSP0017_2-20120614/3645_1 /TAXON_ID=2856 /ORGANISM="Cylindrotheca closterium" /LENGTH=647 /DNA_ID=CAMNT_0000516563 /DNA_START=113 /DNA_END=2056 /DNA_ORIENTATION=+ /assembly_acc=CAM_ASM_000147
MGPSVDAGSKSPFFRPSEKPIYTKTPGGTRRPRKKAKGEEEHKSNIAGCTANIINAIVGAGIIGLPYAIKQAGFVAGIILVVFAALLTEKSLRLLVETAKHAHVPSYETVAEAAFGKFGFIFVAINMFINAYGAMLSYLMIVKDTFSAVLGVEADNFPMKRSILFVISITIMVPIASQRDMADLAVTSRMNVVFDLLMVAIVLYCAPIQESWEVFEWRESIIHYDTVFVGMGVLSFAFVCQHSAFIIAGSLENPTKERWSMVTKFALLVCCSLAMVCGVGGYIGFMDATTGNILNSLDDSIPANVARALLGTTMLFVYPMESFVARHVCVVLFFKGRSAHEGDDTSVLNRRDRRVTLTVLLYLTAAIPAAFVRDVGAVLALSGSVGASSLAYIGPGAVYLGIHGARFLELSKAYFGLPKEENEVTREDLEPLYSSSIESDFDLPPEDSWLFQSFQKVSYYLLLMPIWCRIAKVGKSCLTSHITTLAMQTPHPIRIGNVRFATARTREGNTRVVMFPRRGSTQEDHSSSDVPLDTTLIRSDSFPRGFGALRAPDGQFVALPVSPNQESQMLLPPKKAVDRGDVEKDYKSINQKIGAMAVRRAKEEEFALEDDPQQIPPGVSDFAVAIFYMVFGLLAMIAGVVSIFQEE